MKNSGFHGWDTSQFHPRESSVFEFGSNMGVEAACIVARLPNLSEDNLLYFYNNYSCHLGMGYGLRSAYVSGTHDHGIFSALKSPIVGRRCRMES